MFRDECTDHPTTCHQKVHCAGGVSCDGKDFLLEAHLRVMANESLAFLAWYEG